MTSIRTDGAPRRLGSFEIVRELAQGGMGVVYLGRQPALDRSVVLKKIRRDLLAEPDAVERFQREARAAAAVHHQNVVAVYDCFTNRGDHCIAQEFVDGVDLREALDAGPLPPSVAVLIALEVVRGLEEIHAAGIVHRDLKPANVLVGRGGEVKIADFGIAVESRRDGLTRPGTLVGSVPYLSPEQMLGERADYRSDLFLFGILLYELIVGEPPFLQSEEDATDTLLERMQHRSFVRARRRVAGVPLWLDRLIRRCLHATPARRPQSAREVRERLERAEGSPAPADCRRVIAHHLGTRSGPAEDERTQLRSSASVLPPRRHLRLRRWLPASLVAGLLIAGISGFGLGRLAGDGPRSDRGDSDASRPGFETGAPAAAAGIDAPTIDIGTETRVPAVAAGVPGNVAALDRPSGPLTSLEPSASSARGSAESVSGNQPEAGADPASLRVAAWPWAEVRIDDAPALVTPHADPFSLAPGHHLVRFDHPTFGHAEVEVDLAPGERRLVRHVFDGAPPP